MKQLFYILIFLPVVCIGQTISINGSLHSTNGDNTFPIWVEEGTTIQPNFPIKSISIKEFNVVPNSNGNDLVFNKTVLVYSDSVSTVPEGKTWKLESIQNQIQIGDYAYGGIVYQIEQGLGGKVISMPHTIYKDNQNNAINYCSNLQSGGYNDWYLPNRDEGREISIAFINVADYIPTQTSYWSSQTSQSGDGYAYVMGVDATQDPNDTYTSSAFRVICIRQF